MNSLPFYDLAAVNRPFQSQVSDVIDHVSAESNFILGNQGQAFEKEFADYCGVKHAIGVGNGLEAIVLILLALGISEGDEVIVPSNTYIATWLAVSMAGATIVPVEPNEQTYCIDPEGIKNKITSKTKAIIIVHLYGQLCEMEKIADISSRAGIFLIEDCAQSHGASNEEQIAGSFGIASAFSFYPSKNLGAYGDAGGVTTNDPVINEKVRYLRNYGSKEKYVNRYLGMNSRLDEIQAGILRIKLKGLDLQNASRRKLAEIYNQQLASISELSLPLTPNDNSHVFHLYVVRFKDRDWLKRRLSEQGVETLIHYPIPPHLQECYSDLKISAGSLPISERIHREVLSLPLWPGMTEGEQERVIETIKRIL